jgi:hypothetical protein
MKRIILNLACAISLLAVGFSFWVITSPITVRAAGASADCRGGGSVSCESVGGSCYSHDGDVDTDGYCSCTVNGVQTVLKRCEDKAPLND